MDAARTRLAEDPEQRVEEVNSDVHRDAAGPLDVRLPRDAVPATSGRYVDEIDVELRGAAARLAHTCREVLYDRVVPQLEHGVDVAPRLGLELLERVEVPGLDHQGLLADGVGTHPQRHAHVRVVEVVG